MLLYV